MPRRLFAALLLLLLAGPLLPPALTALGQPGSLTALAEWDRLGSLLANTALLAVMAVAVAVPLGTVLAVAVARGPAWPARVLRAVVVVGLAVPLPVTAVAWQAVLGGWLPSMALEPGAVAWRAWNTGLLPAAWVHGMAGVPWVAWVVGGVLGRTDQILEDDATLSGGWWAVLWRVVLPRAVVAALVGGGWVAVQTATEIPITDSMMVRTFAEEVYTQLVGDVSRVGAAVAVTLPVWLAGAVFVAVLVERRGRVSADVHTARPLVGWGWAVAGGLIVALFAGVPLAALTGKASAGGLIANLSNAILANWRVMLPSVLWAAVAGVVTAWLARRACWHAARRRWFGRLLAAVCVLLFLAPGPVVGFGLLKVIGGLVDAERWAIGGWGLTFPPVRSALYDQPSPLPVLWAAVVRLFPVACAVLWPAVRSVPVELTEAAAIDGVGEWRWVVAPLTRRAFAAAAVGVTGLSLGEVSAAKLVYPAGYKSFILELFQQMHYGAEATVAGLALVQVAITSAVMLGGLWLVGKGNARDGS